MLGLDREERRALWSQVTDAIEGYIEGVPGLPVAPRLDRDALRAQLAPYDFQQPVRPDRALAFAVAGLTHDQVHTPHPRYFGLFNPAPATVGIAADALVAAINPQLAAWSHSPFAAEVESHVVRQIAARFGFDPTVADGTFTTGGAEANHTALLAALVSRFPSFAEEGVRSLPGPPVFYVSTEAHHSFVKAARLCGLGTQGVRAVPADDDLRLDVGALEAQITADRAAGGIPFLVVATGGTTGAGVVDPLPEIADVAARQGLWVHLDAAWGGAAVLVPELRGVLEGSARADSITFDAHKWLSVPMGAGLFLTRHADILGRTFRVQTGYMPKDAAGLPVVDPFAQSMQWSRRFIGLKVFLSLAAAGWDGYAATIRQMAAMGDLLRERLEGSGWPSLNRTPLPVVCFADGRSPRGREEAWLERVVRTVVASGRAWISTVRLAGRGAAIRACITNYATGPADVLALVEALDDARRSCA